MANTFTGFSQETLNFLFQIRINNYRSWFEENKNRYQQFVQLPMQQLVDSLGDYWAGLDPLVDANSKKCISRIYRDIRFSKDKTPYRDHLWCTFKRPAINWQDAPAYYFEISPEGYSYGMGMYMASKDTMDRFRAFIETQPLVFKELIQTYEQQTVFKLEGERYKRVLKPELNLDETLRSWYQLKSFYFVCNKGIEKNLFSEQLLEELKKGFDLLAPFYHELFRFKSE